MDDADVIGVIVAGNDYRLCESGNPTGCRVYPHDVGTHADVAFIPGTDTALVSMLATNNSNTQPNYFLLDNVTGGQPATPRLLNGNPSLIHPAVNGPVAVSPDGNAAFIYQTGGGGDILRILNLRLGEQPQIVGMTRTGDSMNGCGNEYGSTGMQMDASGTRMLVLRNGILQWEHFVHLYRVSGGGISLLDSEKILDLIFDGGDITKLCVNAIAMSHDGKVAVAATVDGRLIVIRGMDTGQLVVTARTAPNFRTAPKRYPRAMAFMPN